MITLHPILFGLLVSVSSGMLCILTPEVSRAGPPEEVSTNGIRDRVKFFENIARESGKLPIAPTSKSAVEKDKSAPEGRRFPRLDEPRLEPPAPASNQSRSVIQRNVPDKLKNDDQREIRSRSQREVCTDSRINVSTSLRAVDKHRMGPVAPLRFGFPAQQDPFECLRINEIGQGKLIEFRVRKILEFVTTEKEYEHTLALILKEKIEHKTLLDSVIATGALKKNMDLSVFHQSKNTLTGLLGESHYFNSIAAVRLGNLDVLPKDQESLKKLEGLLIEHFGSQLKALTELYQSYNVGYERLTKVLSKFDKKHSGDIVSKFLDRYQEVERSRNNLNFLPMVNSLFITPVQRLIKYKNLLADLTQEKYSLHDENTRPLEDLRLDVERAVQEVNAYVMEIQDKNR